MLTQVHERGQGLVEYGIILFLVAVVVSAVLSFIGPILGNIYSEVNNLFP
ncbi:MAG: pilus assembly protein [Chloroflexi bacterium]|nr:pilus assembly protein [Chloroflexota bacterium]